MKILKVLAAIIACIGFITTRYIICPVIEHEAKGVDLDTYVAEQNRDAWRKNWESFSTRGRFDTTSGDLYKSTTDRNQKINEKLDEFSKNIINNQHLQLEDKLDLLIKIQEDLAAAKNYWTQETWHATADTKINDFLQQLEKPIERYITSPENSFLAQEIAQQKLLTKQLAVSSYEQEFKMLASFLSAAKALRTNATPSLIEKNVAKRLFQLQRFLKEKQSWTNFFASFINKATHDLIDENTLKSIINDKNFVSQVEKQIALVQKNNLTTLPEDQLLDIERLYKALPKDISSFDQWQGLLKRLGDLKQYSLDPTFESKRQRLLNDSLDALNKALQLLGALPVVISEKLFILGSLGEPSKERAAMIEQLKKYKEFFASDPTLRVDPNVLKIVNTINDLLDRTKQVDEVRSNKLEEAVSDFLEVVNDGSLELFRKNQEMYDNKIANLRSRCDKLLFSDDFRASAIDLRNVLDGAEQVVMLATNISDFQQAVQTKNLTSVRNAYDEFQKGFDVLKQSLDYNFPDPEDTTKIRPYKSRLEFMQIQAKMLETVQNMFQDMRFFIGGKSYELSDMRELNSEQLIKGGFAEIIGKTQTETQLGTELKIFIQFSEKIQRREQQLKQFITKNKQAPPSYESISSPQLRRLNLQLMIPDDQIDFVQEACRQLYQKTPKTDDQQMLLNFFETGVFTDSNRLLLFDALDIIKRNQDGPLKTLKQDIPEPFFKNLVEFMLETAEASASERSGKVKAFVSFYQRYPTLIRVWGLADPGIIATLDHAKLKDEGVNLSNDMQLSVNMETAAEEARAKEAMFAKREKEAQFFSAMALPAGAAAYAAVKNLPRLVKLVGTIIGAVIGAFFGGALFGVGAVPGAFIGGAIGAEIVGNIYNWITGTTGATFLDKITGGWASEVVAAGVGIYTSYKMWKIAQALQPTIAEYQQLAEEAIKAGITPPAKPEDSGMAKKLFDWLIKNVGTDFANMKIELQQKQNLIEQRMAHFERARAIYCEYVNAILELKGGQKITPAALTHISLDTIDTAIKKAVKKLDTNEKRAAIKKVQIAKSLMISLGVESTKLQFAYEDGLRRMVAGIINSRCLGLASTQIPPNPDSPEFMEKLSANYDKAPKDFNKMLQADYSNLPEPGRKKAILDHIRDWMTFHNRLNQANRDFQVYVEQYKDKFQEKIGKKDGDRIYGLFKEMLNGRLSTNLRAYRSAADAMFKAWDFMTIDWQTSVPSNAPQRAATATT